MKIQRFLLTVSVALGLLVNCKSTTEITKKVDQKVQINNNIEGKILAGYQGWFNAKGDGANLGWKHYGNKGFEPGKCAVDYWPDLTEFDADETYVTPFNYPNGDVAKLFSSENAKTVNRHFKWMKEYGQQLIGKMERTPDHYHPSSDAEILKMVFAEDTDEMDKSLN